MSLGGIIETAILAKKEASSKKITSDRQIENIEPPIMNNKDFNSKHGLKTKYILLITGFSIVFSLDLLYLIMSKNVK